MYVMKEKFGEALGSYTWYDQFKESVGRMIADNPDRALRSGENLLFLGNLLILRHPLSRL